MYKYVCQLGDTNWTACVNDIERYNEQFLECDFEGRGSKLKACVGKSNVGNWIIFTEIDKGCTLASLYDLFWNSEKLTDVLGNEIDATTVASGLYLLSDLLV